MQILGRMALAVSEISASLSEGALLTLAPAAVTFLKFASSSGIPCISHCPSSTLLMTFMQLIFRSTSSPRGSALLYLYLEHEMPMRKAEGKGRPSPVLSLLVCSEERQ